MDDSEIDVKHVLVQFRNEDGAVTGSPFDIPVNVSTKNLELLCNSLLEQDEQLPYSFSIEDTEITDTLEATLAVINKDQSFLSSEKVVYIKYQPMAVFKVRAVTRCTSTIEGHGDAVISVKFSPNGQFLASGSGDTTVRFWDLTTESPQYTCSGHKNWILCIAWSPDGRKLASGCRNGEIRLWNPSTGKQITKVMKGHKQWITSLCFQPLHLDGSCRLLASASKDGTIRIWDVVLGRSTVLSGHTMSVTNIIWSCSNLLYSCSQDRTIKVWRVSDGVLCRTLQGHGHWVNCLALNTNYLMRTGAFEPAEATVVPKPLTTSTEELQSLALNRIKPHLEKEKLVSGSDDFTLFLWNPDKQTKPIAHMTGHQQPINDVCFSPDARLIASASFDKSVKLWDGNTGKFITTLRGHVNRVYQVSWSADSRLLCSGSADSTLKLWDVKKGKLLHDLPGHADEVFAVDWSPDSQRVASGGKDKVLKIWRA